MSADNYYLKDVDFNALHESIQMTYVWHKDASSGGRDGLAIIESSSMQIKYWPL
jgi:hypothetical protein